MTKLNELSISFTRRNARFRGPNSSANWNDTVDELAQDLGLIYSEWNDSLYPLVSTLPDGTVDEDVDAFTDGLDGKTLYANRESTSTSDISFYNSVKSRPNTVYEQLQNLYTYVDDGLTALQAEINTTEASRLSIVDAGNYFTSATVEGALQELGSATRNLLNNNIVLPDADPYTIIENSNTLFHNTGYGTDMLEIDLPSAQGLGETYTFFVNENGSASGGLKIVASSGDTIRVGNEGVSSSGGYISSSTVGATITLTCISSSQWIATSYIASAWSIDS